jgi:hypothetical protein
MAILRKVPIVRNIYVVDVRSETCKVFQNFYRLIVTYMIPPSHSSSPISCAKDRSLLIKIEYKKHCLILPIRKLGGDLIYAFPASTSKNARS